MSPDPIRAALFAKLSADATLTGLLAKPSAIYHRYAPEDSETPYVIFNKQAGTRVWAMQGGQFRWPIWQVKAVDRADSSGAADEIDARIDEILTDAELEIDGFDHLYIRRDSDIDYGQPDSGGLIHHVGGIYRIAVEPA